MPVQAPFLDYLTPLSRPTVEETYLWPTSKWRLKVGKTKNQNLRPIELSNEHLAILLDTH